MLRYYTILEMFVCRQPDLSNLHATCQARERFGRDFTEFVEK